MENTSFVEDCEEKSQSKKELIKTKGKSFWASSRGRIAMVWSLTLTIIICIYCLIPSGNERALEAAFLVSTLLGK